MQAFTPWSSLIFKELPTSYFQNNLGIDQQNSLFELPLLPAHGALVLGLLGAQPLHDAVDVEAVAALPPDQRTVVTRELAVGAATVERDAADAAGVVVGGPLPDGHAAPGTNVDLGMHIVSLAAEYLLRPKLAVCFSNIY